MIEKKLYKNKIYLEWIEYSLKDGKLQLSIARNLISYKINKGILTY